MRTLPALCALLAQERWPGAVQQGWQHFMVERCQPYCEGRRRAGRH